MGRIVQCLVLLTSERTALCKSGFAPRGCAQDGAASAARNSCLSVTENRGDGIATGALDIHEITIRVLHQTFQLVSTTLLLRRRMQ